MDDAADIIDLRGIAQLLEVSNHTPNQWRQRQLLPPVDFPELKHPAWHKSTIIEWARSTGRWPPGTTARPDSRTRRQTTLKAQIPRRRVYRPVVPVRDEAGVPQAVFVPPTVEAA